MGALFGEEVDIDNQFFELTDDDATIAEQFATLALNTPPGALDAFPEYGFEFRSVLLRGLTPTELAMLPLEIRGALEQEPAFLSAEVAISGTPDAFRADISITAAEGDAVGFTIPAG